MSNFDCKIGEHWFRITTVSEGSEAYIKHKCQWEPVNEKRVIDMEWDIEEGYGAPFESFDVEIVSREGMITYRRTDYKIQTGEDFRKAKLSVRDEYSLKHAMMNIYSAFIVHVGWGLLIHSSCVAQGGNAYLFAGQSGAGKSTVARLSQPRPLLSDEATVLKIVDGEVIVFDSPFRSEQETPYQGDDHPPLAAIHLLRQSLEVKRVPMNRVDGMMELMGKVFYWAHQPQETEKIMALCTRLVQEVPVFELYFQKNDTFWEEIS